jgi:hypothetical protein
MKFTPPPDWDPYEDLVELKNFAVAADAHIANLLKNEKEMISAINELSSRLKTVRQKIDAMENKYTVVRPRRK